MVLFIGEGKGLEMHYLGFDVAVAADSPQVLEGPPQEDDEETPEERHHG